MTTSAFPTPTGSASDHPDEPTHLTVTDMARSLDFYLDLLGCEVRRAADGWAMLCYGETCFVLVHAATPGPNWQTRSRPNQPADSPPRIRLSTPDLRALRRRLLATDVTAAPITGSARESSGEIEIEIEISDPDQHPVVIEQLGPSPAGVPPAHHTFPGLPR